jgi:SAM-dependent MidA family methyltransferase
MLLSEIITQKIKEEGPLSFRDFMEMCLYYPNLGYYTSAQDKIGKKGDFYTSSNVTPVFGAMIGKQFEEMWEILGTDSFTIVEYGAGQGLLCQDILTYLKHNKKLYDRLSYCIIEKSPVMREKQKAHLSEKVRWYDRIEDIGEITGCVLSNELVDNFSVHQVVMEGELMEVYVDYEDGFKELLIPANNLLTEYLSELAVQLPKGFRTEINLEATQWIQNVASALKSGYVLTIDYGYASSELYHESRRYGTVVCYREHQVNDSPYQNIGEQDITTHVNFSALCHWGSKKGLTCYALINQADFLVAHGFRDHLMRDLEKEKDILQAARKASFITKTLLLDMGSKFKVLIQEKGIPKDRQRILKCFSY